MLSSFASAGCGWPPPPAPLRMTAFGRVRCNTVIRQTASPPATCHGVGFLRSPVSDVDGGVRAGVVSLTFSRGRRARGPFPTKGAPRCRREEDTGRLYGEGIRPTTLVAAASGAREGE